MKRLHLLLCLLVLAVVAAVFSAHLRTCFMPWVRQYTLEERLRQIGGPARARLKPHFVQAHVTYPPAQAVLLGLKQAKELQVYALVGSNYQYVCTYPILAASGLPGPKLREGDRQVPEGLYTINELNPNSVLHVGLHLSYPNDFDRQQAALEGRTNLGEDIMIHGGAVSIGCLAMGTQASEDLFVLAADTGLTNLTVVLAPVDFRKGETVPKAVTLPKWSEQLYETVRQKMKELPLPPAP